jgi:hypothetical protein
LAPTATGYSAGHHSLIGVLLSSASGGLDVHAAFFFP